MLIGSILTAPIPGMMLGNMRLWLVPPVRRLLNKNVAEAEERGTAFRRSMMGLAKVCCFSVPVGAVPLVIDVFIVA